MLKQTLGRIKKITSTRRFYNYEKPISYINNSCLKWIIRTPCRTQILRLKGTDYRGIVKYKGYRSSRKALKTCRRIQVLNGKRRLCAFSIRACLSLVLILMLILSCIRFTVFKVSFYQYDYKSFVCFTFAVVYIYNEMQGVVLHFQTVFFSTHFNKILITNR